MTKPVNMTPEQEAAWRERKNALERARVANLPIEKKVAKRQRDLVHLKVAYDQNKQSAEFRARNYAKSQEWARLHPEKRKSTTRAYMKEKRTTNAQKDREREFRKQYYLKHGEEIKAKRRLDREYSAFMAHLRKEEAAQQC